MIQNPSFKYEKLLWEKGFNSIAGLDEVGRGAFAGPVVAAAVILPKEFNPKDINDSKLLSPLKRKKLSKYILKNALFYSICKTDLDFINKYGIGKATEKAFLSCLDSIKDKFDYALIDGFSLKGYKNSNQAGIIHGDRLSVSIAAASIIAKVYRDNLMEKLHKDYPLYNFSQNKGYGTKFHRDALKQYGLCKLHRTSFNLSAFLG